MPYDPQQVGADFDGLGGAEARTDLDAYVQEIEASRAAVAHKDLDALVPSRCNDPRKAFDIRWIYPHMIEEYARHNGHADLLRERIDGTSGTDNSDIILVAPNNSRSTVAPQLVILQSVREVRPGNGTR